MTRIIIFSDLHANWEALLALQQAERRPDAIVCLGDIVGYGPDPKRCLDAVRANAAHTIRGRYDSELAKDNRQLDYLRSMLPDADRNYLASLPTSLTVEIAGARFHLTRLPPDDAETETEMLITIPQARLCEIFAETEADIILLGGPHIPAMRQVGGRLIVCPGSVGQPRYGVPDPTFAAWEDGRVQIHHLHYNPQATINKLSLLPLDPERKLELQAILQTGGLEE